MAPKLSSNPDEPVALERRELSASVAALVGSLFGSALAVTLMKLMNVTTEPFAPSD